jgi:hypothetical protein
VFETAVHCCCSLRTKLAYLHTDAYREHISGGKGIINSKLVSHVTKRTGSVKYFKGPISSQCSENCMMEFLDITHMCGHMTSAINHCITAFNCNFYWLCEHVNVVIPSYSLCFLHQFERN